MGIFNDLIEALVERNRIEFSGTLTIGLRKDSIEIKGEIPATVVDTDKNKVLANLVVPVDANIGLNAVTFPIPTLQ